MKINRNAAVTLAMVLALFFGTKAVGGGWVPFVQMLANAYWVHSHVSVPASVIDLDLKDREPVVRYRYVMDDIVFEASTIGLIVPESENHFDWIRLWYQKLKQAKETSQPIQAWVDPTQPQRAFLDRQINWIVVVYWVPFVVFFPLVAFFASRQVLVVMRASVAGQWRLDGNFPFLHEVSVADPDKWAFSKSLEATDPPYLHDLSKDALSVAYWIAAVWCLVVWPIVGGFISSRSVSGVEPWLIFVFPVGMVILLAYCARASFRYRAMLGTRVYTQPRSVRIGETFALTVELPAADFRGVTQFELTLTGNRTDFADSGFNRNSTIWKATQLVTLLPRAQRGGQLRANFLIPISAIPTQPEFNVDNARVQWTVDVEARGGGFAQSFEIAVLPRA